MFHCNWFVAPTFSVEWNKEVLDLIVCCLKDRAVVWRCWVVQAGLLTTLTFAWHRLSPLAAFTSGAYFLHNGRWWQWICEFYTVNFKGIFGGLSSECVWQQAITCCSCYRMPQNAFYPQNRSLLVNQKTMQIHFFPTLHPLSPVIFATATVVAFVLFRNSSSTSIVIHSVKQRLLRNRPGSDTAISRDFLRERLQREFTCANQLYWTAQYSKQMTCLWQQWYELLTEEVRFRFAHL